MMTLKKRLAELEARKRSWPKVDRLTQDLGQSEDEALDSYGRDRIGPDDLIVIRRIVAPRLRADQWLQGTTATLYFPGEL